MTTLAQNTLLSIAKEMDLRQTDFDGIARRHARRLIGGDRVRVEELAHILQLSHTGFLATAKRMVKDEAP